MSSRPDPKRIYEAQRAGTLRRLIGEGELPDRAERLVAQWELQAAQDGLERDGRYWDAGWAWCSARGASQRRCHGPDRLAQPGTGGRFRSRRPSLQPRTLDQKS